MNEKISVIVPVYNVEKYLKTCVESLLAQTYENIEVLLVDDGSTDSSGSLCDTLACRDERIRVFHKKNGGLSDARNYGFDEATGTYVVFVDSDDYVHPEMLAHLMHGIVENNADISICGYRKVAEENNTQEVLSEAECRGMTAVQCMETLPHINLVTAWAKLYKKELFDKQNIRYPVGKLHEDEFTTYKLIYQAKRCAFTEEALYYYRVRIGSITTGSYNLNRLHGIVAMEEARKFFEEKQEINICGRYTKWLLGALATNILLLKKDKQDHTELIKKMRTAYRDICRNDLGSVKTTFIERCKISAFLINESMYELIQNSYDKMMIKK